MKGLGKRQKRVLELIIEDVRAHGIAPTQRRVADLSGIAAPWKALQGLAEKGYLHHPYPGAPWAPVRGVDGEPLRLELAPVEEAKS